MTILRRKLLRDLARHRVNFIAVGLTVFLGVTLFAASYDSFRNLQASYSRTATDFKFANLTVAGGDPATIASEFRAAGVEAVATRTSADVPFEVGATKLLGRVVGMPATGQPSVNQVKVIDGSYLDPASPDGVLVEQHMATHFDLQPGSTLSVGGTGGWQQLTVLGIASSPEYIWPARDRQDLLTTPDNFGVLFAPEATAASLAGPGSTEVVAYYAGGDPDAALTTRLEQVAGRQGATAWYTRADQPSNAALEEDLQGFQELALFFPILFLVAAGMAAYVMINRLVFAQRPHIGVLLAEGFTRRQVLLHYLGYGLVPGLLGAVPGAAAGVLLARLITGLYTEMLSVPVRVIQFYPATLATGVVIGLAATVVAAGAPALVASRVVPAAAMRGTLPTGGGRPSLAERLIPPLRRLPIRWRMTLRGIERNTRRTLYTIIGVVLSLVLVLVSWGMIDTVRHLMDRQFLVIQREDARVYFVAGAGATAITDVEQVAGVAVAEPSVEAPVTLTAGARRYDTALTVFDAGTSMHRFFAPDGAGETLPADGLLVGQAVRGQLGVGVGDDIQISVPALGLTVDDRIAGFVDEPLGTVAYASFAHVHALLGTTPPATAALIRYLPGADPAAVRAAVSALPVVAAFEDSRALYDTMQRYMNLFYAFVGVMLAFGAAMAFALVFNSMSVNIAERSREVATLLAVGADRSTVSRLITTENLLVALAGVPVGLALGTWVSSLAMSSFNSDLFSFNLYVNPTTLLWSAVAILAVAALSQLPGLRSVARLDIARTVKERTT